MNLCNCFVLFVFLANFVSCSPPVLRTFVNDSEIPVQLDNITHISDVDVPESRNPKIPLASTSLQSISLRNFDTHTHKSRKAHDALEHVVQTMNGNSTTIHDAQRQSMLLLVQQALELLRLSLTAPPKP